jgi:mono/diheme cytochrome c family protein
MTSRRVILSSLLALAAATLLFTGSLVGQQGGKPAPATAADSTPVAAASQQDDEALRLEGEKRFRANCGRCHQSPHKFPPRMVMTIERHMRVRATLSDEDMRLIVRYLTQ